MPGQRADRNSEMMMKDKKKILVVDDEPDNLHVLRHILQDDYELIFAKDGERAVELATTERPDLILLDVMMPGLSGYATCEKLKSNPVTQPLPVIFITAMAEVENETIGFDVGAVDYITKPVSPPIVKARVRTHLSLVHTAELKETRLQIIQCLGLAAEYKDDETGLHVIRMSHYAKVIAVAAGFTEERADDLLNAAPMHDVGKIGIPDSILKKAGKLTEEEWKIMQTHATIGAEIIGEHKSPLLISARTIALTHHEKWNGTGYPNGLKGNDIPIEGRIVALADVFDALTTVRPYKKAWSVPDAVGYIQKESGGHFDPELASLFVEQLPALLKVREQWVE